MNWVNEELKRSKLDEQTALEFMLIFTCAGSMLKPGCPSSEIISDIISRHSRDWRGFIKLVRENRVTAIIYQALRSLPPHEEMKPILEAIKRSWMGSAAHMLMITTELTKLSKLFAANSIPVISFKGPALAMQAYGGIHMRPCSDLDLLVAPEDHARAETLLLQEGYNYLTGELPFKRNKVRKPTWSHTHMIQQKTGTHVELHFDLLHFADAHLFAFDDLWRQRVTVVISNTTVSTLPLPLHCIYLSMHGEQHGWQTLIWLYDIAVLTNGMTAEEIAALTALAKQHGQRKRLENSLLLARLLFGPDNRWKPYLRNTSDTQPMTYPRLALQLIIQRHIRGRNLSLRHYWLAERLRWAGIATVKGKWRFLIAHLLPREMDVAEIELSKHFYFLHYLLRPVWVLRRKLGLLHRPG
ncbi:MAG: nucleotidyltransferase family protein [Smithellaceae bacterium]|nr:nucleotidyltransferase family protein [Smithellaceae bacterium]